MVIPYNGFIKVVEYSEKVKTRQVMLYVKNGRIISRRNVMSRPSNKIEIFIVNKDEILFHAYSNNYYDEEIRQVIKDEGWNMKPIEGYHEVVSVIL